MRCRTKLSLAYWSFNSWCYHVVFQKSHEFFNFSNIFYASEILIVFHVLLKNHLSTFTNRLMCDSNFILIIDSFVMLPWELFCSPFYLLLTICVYVFMCVRARVCVQKVWLWVASSRSNECDQWIDLFKPYITFVWNIFFKNAYFSRYLGPGLFVHPVHPIHICIYIYNSRLLIKSTLLRV